MVEKKHFKNFLAKIGSETDVRGQKSFGLGF